MVSRVVFSKRETVVETPPDFFEFWNRRLAFSLDVCASKENAKCRNYFTEKENGLIQPWGGFRVWCNPPYSHIGDWVDKALKETGSFGCPVACLLLPSRTDRPWYQQLERRPHRVYLENVEDRLIFVGSKQAAPFPSVVAVIWGGTWNPEEHKKQARSRFKS